jgi:hypothetical protein
VRKLGERMRKLGWGVMVRHQRQQHSGARRIERPAAVRLRLGPGAYGAPPEGVLIRRRGVRNGAGALICSLRVPESSPEELLGND